MKINTAKEFTALTNQVLTLAHVLALTCISGLRLMIQVIVTFCTVWIVCFMKGCVALHRFTRRVSSIRVIAPFHSKNEELV